MRHIFKKYILILLVLSMVVSSFATIASAFSFTGGSITMTNLHPNATVKYEHIIRPNTSRETGWEFFPGLDSRYDCWYSILHAFAEAYGFGSLDNKFDGKLSTSWATATEEYIAFEQEVLKAVIADYDKSYGNGDPNTAAISGTVNASKNFREALRLSNEYYLKKGNGVTKTANGNGEVTVVDTTSNNDNEKILTQTGLYLIVPQGNSEYSYNPTAAYLGFQYSSNIPNAHQSVTVKAKRISNIADKTVGSGSQSLSVGDTASYTITSTYPYIPEQYWDTAIYMITDKSSQLENYQNVTVRIEGEDNPLIQGTDYMYTVYKKDTWGFNGILIRFVDKDSNFGEYCPEYAGKKITITYTATVMDLNDNGQVENIAETTIKSEGDRWINASKCVSETYEHRMLKVNEDDFTISGAQFNVKDSSGKYLTFNTNEIGEILYCEVSGTSNTAQVITVPRGGVVFKGLDYDKTYTVTEIKAPDGYSLSSTPYVFNAASLGLTLQTVVTQEEVGGINTTTKTNKIVLASDPSKDATFENVQQARFKNTKLYDLPETGSIGTYVFTLVGVSIMASALLVFVSQRKETEV